ncbi:hypothetical protein [Streptomyces acidiscabies]|uniref:hypothetical protein n=1 Tax=Streptomyces acidiscabies TaxID=42234 RepID=UPI000E678C25|nr:hypothetical protein [Streptomyces acidiscabies]MBP5942617.1 hypothetical protein [Streptomyces sp. LBUM 1476]
MPSFADKARQAQDNKRASREKDPADLSDAKEPDWDNPPTGPSRAPRRRGRPRGPERVALTVRILPATDRKLTAAVEQTGLNPQTLVEQALESYFRRLKIEDPDSPKKGSEGAA